jgi:hypothetical protein
MQHARSYLRKRLDEVGPPRADQPLFINGPHNLTDVVAYLVTFAVAAWAFSMVADAVLRAI